MSHAHSSPIITPTMPKATSVITNQAIVRNALNKPRGSGRRNNGKNNSNTNNSNSQPSEGSFSNRGRKGLTLYNGNESGTSQPFSNRSGNSSKSRAPKQQQQQQGKITDSITSGGRRNRAKLSPLEQQEQDSNYTATNDASETNPLPDSQRRRIRSSGSNSSSGTNNNSNNNNNNNNNNAPSPSKRNKGSRQQPTKPLDSADPLLTSSTISLPNLPSSGRRGKSSKSNLDSVSRPSRRGGKRSKQLDDSENSEEEKDLKEVLFPDLFGHKSSNNGPTSSQRCKLYNTNNNNNNNIHNNCTPNFDNNPATATAGSGTNGGPSTTSPSKICFAGSSFSNTPDPSALPKPAFMGKVSPKSHHSTLSVDTSDHLSDQDATTSSASSPSSVSTSPIKQVAPPSPKEVSLKQSQEQLKQISPPSPPSIQFADVQQQQQQQPQQASPFYGLVSGAAPPYVNGPIYPYTFGPAGPYPSQNGAMPVPVAMNNPAPSPYFYEPNNPFYAPPLSNMPYPMQPQQQLPQLLPQQQQQIAQPLGFHKNQENFALENDLKRLLNVGH